MCPCYLGYYGNAPVTVVNPAPTASPFTSMPPPGNVTSVLSNPTNHGPASAQNVVMFNGHNFLARAHPGIDVSGTGGRGHCQLKMFRARAQTIGQRALNGHIKM